MNYKELKSGSIKVSGMHNEDKEPGEFNSPRTLRAREAEGNSE